MFSGDRTASRTTSATACRHRCFSTSGGGSTVPARGATSCSFSRSASRFANCSFVLAKAFASGSICALARRSSKLTRCRPIELGLVNVALPGELGDRDIDIDVVQLREQLAFFHFLPGTDVDLVQDAVDGHVHRAACRGLHFERAVNVRRQRHETDAAIAPRR